MARPVTEFIADAMARAKERGPVIGLVMVMVTEHGALAVPHLGWWHAERVAAELTTNRLLDMAARACRGTDTN